VRYEANPKHKHPWQRGRRGSLCPPDVTLELAQRLLEGSVQVGKSRYAVLDGRAFRAQKHSEDAWHGYPVQWHEVPPQVRASWCRDGLVSKKQIRQGW
jgi:hypothetical protein